MWSVECVYIRRKRGADDENIYKQAGGIQDVVLGAEEILDAQLLSHNSLL